MEQMNPIDPFCYPSTERVQMCNGLCTCGKHVRCGHPARRKVGPEALGASASAGTATYTRVVARSANEGRFLVAIHSNAGILRMQGAYLDSTLTVADGIFKYYHPNGRLESTGTFTAGIESGTWLRYGPDGKELSERVYTGRSVDDLVQGTDRSPMTIGGPQLVDPSPATNKRRTVSSEF